MPLEQEGALPEGYELPRGKMTATSRELRLGVTILTHLGIIDDFSDFPPGERIIIAGRTDENALYSYRQIAEHSGMKPSTIWARERAILRRLSRWYDQKKIDKMHRESGLTVLADKRGSRRPLSGYYS